MNLGRCSLFNGVYSPGKRQIAKHFSEEYIDSSQYRYLATLLSRGDQGCQ